MQGMVPFLRNKEFNQITTCMEWKRTCTAEQFVFVSKVTYPSNWRESWMTRSGALPPIIRFLSHATAPKRKPKN